MNDSPTAIMPFSNELEQATLGAMVISPDNIDGLGLEVGDFYIDRHKWIFQAMRTLKEKGSAVDALTISDCLSQMGYFQDSGGPAYLASLINACPSFLHLEDYAATLKRYSLRRRVLQKAQEMAAAAIQDDMTEDALLEKVTTAIENLESAQSSGIETVPLSHFLSQVYDEVEYAMNHPGDIWGIPCGLLDLDALTGGFHPGDLFYIAGRPGVGKSRFATAIALGLAEKGNAPGNIYSIEMKGEAIGYRIISAEAKIPTRDLHTGKGKIQEDFTAFAHAVDKLSSLPIALNDKPISIAKLRADLKYHKRKRGIKWAMVDYLQLIEGYEKLDEAERTEKFSHALKQIAKEEDLILIVLNSVVKEGMSDGSNAAPEMTDMRGSGQQIHDADLIGFVTQGRKATIMKVVFVKTRDVAAKAGIFIELYQHPTYPLVDNLSSAPEGAR